MTTRSHSRRQLTLVCALCVGSLSVAIDPLRADNIDEALIRQAPKIMNHLRNKGYKNVGVLTFRVKKGNEPTTFAGGLMTTNMADRLENALVLAMNPEQEPIGIIKDAGGEAAEKLEDANYRKPDARLWLFKPEYPLKWGQTQLVKADAFLTGKVTLSPDLKMTNVAVESFDQATPAKITRLLDFSVKTDRYILADLGQGFSLSRALSKGRQQFRRGSADADDDIIIFDEFEDLDLDGSRGPGAVAATSEDIVETGQEPATGNEPPANRNEPKSSDRRTPSNRSAGFPVELKIYYNGKEQGLRSDSPSGTDNWRVDDPKAGERVTFGLRNLTNERLGVVLTINGFSTLFKDVGQPNQMTKWVLEPNKEYLVKGFHETADSFINIEGLSDQLSREKFEDFGLNAGQIHLYVFRPSVSAGSTPGFSRSMRRVAPATLVKTPPRTPWDLQALIARNANAKGTRGLMAWAMDEGKEQLKELSLGDVGLTDTMVVIYYSKP